MTGPLIAGHTFGNTSRGHGCIHCGRTWVEILDRKADWIVGKSDIAHVGELNDREVGELYAYEAVYHDWIWRVTMGRDKREEAEAEEMLVTW